MTEMQQKKTLGIAIASLVFGCLFLIPLLGVIFSLAAIILGIVALVKISQNKDTLKGSGLAISGITLGAVGILIIPIVAMLAAIAIPNLLRARVQANQAAARASVMTIATALETYAAANNGKYPSSEYELVQAQPPYLNGSYDKKIINGYVYSLNLRPEGYEVKAEPEQCMTTGMKIFTKKGSAEITEYLSQTECNTAK